LKITSQAVVANHAEEVSCAVTIFPENLLSRSEKYSGNKSNISASQLFCPQLLYEQGHPKEEQKA
jgi:hypothetical protein